MKLLLSLIAIVLAFTVGVFAEHHFSVLHRVVKHEVVMSSTNTNRCECDNPCEGCLCCQACNGKDKPSGKCTCPNCDCCNACPGHKVKK
jgi:hypothetical protein